MSAQLDHIKIVNVRTKRCYFAVMYEHNLITAGQAYSVGLVNPNADMLSDVTLSVNVAQYHSMRNAVGTERFDSKVSLVG